jgi:hypothetical protein
MKDLIGYYNEGAAELGRSLVKKFQDRATAERRCDEIQKALRANRGEKKEKIVLQSQPEWNFATVRANSNRQKLLSFMVDHRNEFVTVDAMADAVYGDTKAAKGKSAVLMILKGIKVDIAKNSVPAELRQDKKSYGLFDIG